VTRPDPVVQILYRNPTETGGTVRALVLADDRFGGGLAFELTFVGTELFGYSVTRNDPGPLPNASTLRQVPLDHLRRACLADLQAKRAAATGEVSTVPEMRPDLPELLRRWGKRQTSTREVRLATVAACYVALLTERAPTKMTEAETGYKRDYVDQMLKEARDEGLLTRPPRRGVPGGELTPRAIAILKKEQD
jgi:hypothetical protein